MSYRIEDYSVGQLAKLSGVSVRTLHHYDTIGLLKPAHVGPNRYRSYGRTELLQLQEILFYRAVGMPLAKIADILAGPEDAVARLMSYRETLAAEAERFARMLDLLDTTIAHLRGKRDMANEDLYRPFAPEKQAEYEEWLTETYGGEMAERIANSKEAIQALPDGMESAMGRLRDIETRLVAAHEAGTDPASDENHETLEEHRALMAQLWGRDCPPEGVEGLAETYRAHPDFVARYESLSPGFSHWLPAAMKAHAARLRAST